MRACVCASVHACVRACVHASVCVCVCSGKGAMSVWNSGLTDCNQSQGRLSHTLTQQPNVRTIKVTPVLYFMTILFSSPSKAPNTQQKQQFVHS